tara:strand:- start:7255 stop:8232 length:978 start_codon:yes stop_codon:yes gene_type:complete
MNTLSIIIYIVPIAAVFLFLFLYLIEKNRNLSILKENKRINKKILINLENERIIDSLNSILEDDNLNYQNLCNSVRISTNSSSVIFSEMNKHNGSFKAKFYSSSETLNLDSYLSESNDDKTLAIITGIEGTGKISSANDKDIFPKWFDEIKFNNVICLPIIKRIETIGCIYLFFSKKENEQTLEKKMQNANLLIKLSQRVNSTHQSSGNIYENPNAINNEELIKKNRLVTINLNENTEVLNYKNNQISLSSSEYSIMKNLINKNGRILLYEEILTILWPNSEKVNKTAMRLHIHRLREKTNNISNNLNFIKTLRGKGIYIDTELL